MQQWILNIKSWAQGVWPNTVGPELLTTFALIAFCSLAMKAHSAFMRNANDLPLEARRARMVNFRNRVGLVFLAVFFLTWAGEIRSVLLSLAAIAAAMLIVSKEMITNLLGGAFFIATKPARIGSVVEINGAKGELSDASWFYLTLQEIGPSKRLTGRELKIPNSALLTHPLTNHSSLGLYKITTLPIPVRAAFAAEAKEILESQAKALSGEYAQAAQAQMQALKNRHFHDAPDAQAAVSMVPKDKDTVELHLRYCHPSTERSRSEQLILQQFYQWLAERELQEAQLHAELKASSHAKSGLPEALA